MCIWCEHWSLKGLLVSSQCSISSRWLVAIWKAALVKSVWLSHLHVGQSQGEVETKQFIVSTEQHVVECYHDSYVNLIFNGPYGDFDFTKIYNFSSRGFSWNHSVVLSLVYQVNSSGNKIVTASKYLLVPSQH